MGAALTAVDKLIRLHFLGFSWMLVLLGAASVGETLRLPILGVLLAVGLSFHIYAYVLNDVVDLPVDRTQPSRAGDPLVRGDLRPWQALALALVQIPLAVGLVLVPADGPAPAATLLAGFFFMGLYDIWGKRCAVPPATDLAQGLGWASLVLCGAFLVGEPTALTWVAFLYGAGFILLINGVHGGLRDLANDLATGCRTTAIFFGCRPTPGDGSEAPVRVTRGLRLFAAAVQAGLVVVSLAPLVRNDFGYALPTLVGTAVTVALLNLASLWNLRRLFQPERPGWGLALRFHLFVLLFTWLVLFLPSLDLPVALVLLAGFFLPTVFFEATHEVLRRVQRRVVRRRAA